MISQTQEIKIFHVLRNLNREEDKLASQACTWTKGNLFCNNKDSFLYLPWSPSWLMTNCLRPTSDWTYKAHSVQIFCNPDLVFLLLPNVLSLILFNTTFLSIFALSSKTCGAFTFHRMPLSLIPSSLLALLAWTQVLTIAAAFYSIALQLFLPFSSCRCCCSHIQDPMENYMLENLNDSSANFYSLIIVDQDCK